MVMSADSRLQPRRSLNFLPGRRPEMYPKAVASGADIVCIDLEDGILPEHKDEARQKTMALMTEVEQYEGVETVVRINSPRTAHGLADLLAIQETDTPPARLMLPKVSDPEEIRILDELLTGSHGDIRFQVIIETNRGLAACLEIAQASDRIDALLFGGIDMAAELRVDPTWTVLLYARSCVVHAAASASLDLLDVPFMDLEDRAGLIEAASAAKDLGFTGKAAIHPKQISHINRVFSPTADEVAHARRVIQAFEDGDGGLVVVNGKLIEIPVLKSLQRILAVADRLDGPTPAE